MRPQIATRRAVRAVLLVLLAAPAAASAQMALLAPAPLLPATGATGVRGAELAVALLPDGEAVALTATDRIAELARQGPDGGWRRIAQPPAGRWTRPLVASLPGGQLAALWTTGGQSRASVRSPAGRWSPPVVLSGAGAAQPALAAGAGGVLAAAWIRAGAIEVRARSAAGAWGPVARLAPPAGSLAGGGLAVDGRGAVTVAWTEARASDGTAAGVAWSASSDAGAGRWGSPTELPDQTGDATAAPLLGVDAAGSTTAAWADGGALRAATRTVSAGRWMASRPSRDLPVSAIGGSLALAVAPSGRTLVTAISPSSGGLRARLLLREGTASPWLEIASVPGVRADPLSVADTAISGQGEALVALAGRGGGGCSLMMVQVPSQSDRVSGPAVVAGGCATVQLAALPDGRAIALATDGHGAAWTTSRALAPLRLRVARVGASGSDGRRAVVLRVRVNEPAVLSVRLRRGARTLLSRGVAVAPGWRRVHVPMAARGHARPNGAYRILLRARSGTLGSAVITVPVTVRHR